MSSAADQPRLRWGARFSPHVLVLLATVLFTWWPLQSAIVSGVFWWWGPTYRQVEFVMDEAQVNAGYPYIDGHVDGETEVMRISGMMVGDQVAPEGAPGETFAPGRHIRLWTSPSAPDFGVEGVSVNDFSVAARPTLSGLGAFLDAAAKTLVVLLAGLYATIWVGMRWARRWGQIDIRSGRTSID